MAVAGFVTDRLPSAPSRSGRRRLSSLTISLLLHALVILSLLVVVRLRPRQPNWLPPPAVDMVFQGGSKEGPSVPNQAPPNPNLPPSPEPAPQATPTPPAPPPARVAPQAAPPAPELPVPPQQPPAPPVQPAPAQVAPPPKAEQPPPPARPAPAQVAPPPKTEQPPPPSAVEAPPKPAPLPLPQSAAPAESVPPPPPAPATPKAAPQPPMETAIQLVPPPPLDLLRPPPPLPRLPAPPRPAPPPRPRPHPVLPTPMAYSFGAPPRLQPSPHGTGGRGAIDLAFAPAGRFADQLREGAWSEDKEVGDDWLNLLSAWWQRHAYYPREAGMNGEQGITTVKLRVRHDGTVETVQLEAPSGFPWLDMAAVAVFRGATLPPLPSDVTAASIPLHLTIHYIIIN